MNRRSRAKTTAASLVFLLLEVGQGGSKDKVGCVGSHGLNNSPTKWPISGPVSRGENGQ